MLQQQPCTRALLYLRVSGTAQAQLGVSLPSQEQICGAYAAARGWQVVGVYQDVASGRLENRPAYQRLLQDAASLRADGGPIVVVVSARTSLRSRAPTPAQP